MNAKLLHEYLAVPLADRGVADAAKCAQWNLKWAPQDRDRATHKDWQAYQNLLQLTGILATAELGNAKKVWESIAEFVETRQMAEVEIMPAKLQKTSFTTAQQLLHSDQHALQSPAPAHGQSQVMPCAGSSSSGAGGRVALSPEQIERIRINREQALTRKSAKTRNESGDIENSPAALLHAMASEQPFRSLA